MWIFKGMVYVLAQHKVVQHSFDLMLMPENMPLKVKCLIGANSILFFSVNLNSLKVENDTNYNHP